MRARLVLAAFGLAALAAAPLALARPKPPAASIATAPSPPAESDWRVPDPQNVLVLETTKGRIILELNPLVAPNHVERLRTLTRQGFYDGRSFFRVLDNFMDQTGDPQDSGLGQSSLPNLKAEFTFRRGSDTPFGLAAREGGSEQGMVGSLPVVSQTLDLAMMTADHRVQAYGVFCAGVLGMARSEDEDSANSQFFLMRTNSLAADHATHSLDRKYTAFGHVLIGQDAVDAMKIGEPAPQPQDKVLSAKVLADMPEDTRPHLRVVDAASPWFQAEAARQRELLGPDFSVCDISLPAEAR